jgi:hypothetical protein
MSGEERGSEEERLGKRGVGAGTLGVREGVGRSGGVAGGFSYQRGRRKLLEKMVLIGGSHLSLAEEGERLTPSGFNWVGYGPLPDLGQKVS